jgi:hypothetical protein
MMNLEIVPPARRSRPLHHGRALPAPAPQDEPRFAPVVGAGSGEMFGYEVTFPVRRADQPLRSLGPRATDAAGSVPRDAFVLLHLGVDTNATDIAALATDLERGGVSSGRFILVFSRSMRLAPRSLDELAQVARGLGLGWSHEVTHRAAPARAMRWWHVAFGEDRRRPVRMVTGIDAYADLSSALADGAELLHGRVLGAPSAAPAPLRFTRRALVRAAAPRRVYPRIL